MSWITVIWSGIAGICLALAGVHLLVWTQSRRSWANLSFSIASAAAAAVAVLELTLMRSATPAQFGELLRWMHVPMGVMVIALIWFVWFYLQAGRLWLAWLICGLRVLVCVLNFSMEPNLNFLEITGLRPIDAWGDMLVTPIGVKNPWTNITHLSAILLLIFVLDAAAAAWRRGNRRRAKVVGIIFGGAIVVAILLSELLNRGMLPVPFSISLLFLFLLVGVAYELSCDLARTGVLAGELQQSQQRLHLAAQAADIGVWEWDIIRDEVWVSDTIRKGSGLGASERIALEGILQILVHPDDRDHIRRTIRDALDSDREFQVEYRGIAANDATRCLSRAARWTGCTTASRSGCGACPSTSPTRSLQSKHCGSRPSSTSRFSPRSTTRSPSWTVAARSSP